MTKKNNIENLTKPVGETLTPYFFKRSRSYKKDGPKLHRQAWELYLDKRQKSLPFLFTFALHLQLQDDTRESAKVDKKRVELDKKKRVLKITVASGDCV